MAKKRYIEYGLYIRKAPSTNDYVVGFVGAGPVGRHYPTRDDAEIALNSAIDAVWEDQGSDIHDVLIESLM